MLQKYVRTAITSCITPATTTVVGVAGYSDFHFKKMYISQVKKVIVIVFNNSQIVIHNNVNIVIIFNDKHFNVLYFSLRYDYIKSVFLKVVVPPFRGR